MSDGQAPGPRDALDAIALIGMSGRWPGARDVDAFWSNLCAGVESIRPFSAEELARAGFDPAVLSEPGYVNAGAPIDDPEWFDAGFFGITPREAQSLDPQRRVFLECVWHALEDAGQMPEHVRAPIGIFAGSSLTTYLYRVQANAELVAAVGAYQTIIGNDKDHLTTYTAYKLNLTGPAVTVQTACSTSLVAAAMACQSLLNHECDLAIAGGVSIRLPQHFGYFYQEGGILSPDGHCRPFDAAARGTVTGHGAGVVVLKRLSDAERDGDAIHAVVLGAAINNDGAQKVGYTAPSVAGQAEVIATALALAGIPPGTLGYIEAHGTATPLGDPIEIAGLTQAMGSAGRRNFCGIGSVKGNIGHLDAAAGVSGLIKTALCVERGTIPPSLHFSQPNPAIDFSRSPVYVQDCLREWPRGATPRRAAVSSFGIGGTNAHLVLEEPPEPDASGPSRPVQILALSARSEQALQQLATSVVNDLHAHPERPLADAAYTLALGRRAFRHRRFLVGDSVDTVALDVASAPPAQVADTAEVVFLFPGQGSQRAGMGRELYEQERVFREQVDRCAALLEPHIGIDIRTALFGRDASDEALRATMLAQPALFTVEYACARLLMSWGIAPVAMMGHSLGEYVAACLAGVFSLEDALPLVALRGRLMQSTAPGGMLATSLSEDQAQPFVTEGVSIASLNGPAQTVLSGPEPAIVELERVLREHGVTSKRLRTSHAFHSLTMDPVLDAFRARLERVELRAPAIPYIANLTGTWQTAAASDPRYWVDHMRLAVRFADGCRELARRAATFVEVGPGNTLATLLQPHLRGSKGASVACDLDARSVARTVGTLWSRGADVRWTAYYAAERRRRVRLPQYPFERQRYDAYEGGVPAVAQAQKRADLGSWFYLPAWRQTAPVPATPPAGSYLVFSNDSALSGAVVAQLRAAGLPVVTVETGEAFAPAGADHFRIRAEDAGDYAALFDALAREGHVPDRVLHFWNAADTRHDPERTFFPLLYLAQALGQRAAPALVTVVSAHLQSVTGAERIDASKATLLGVCRVAPYEQPHVRWRSIDVESCGAEHALQVIAEGQGDALEPVVAYRAARRWIETIEPAPLPAGSPSGSVLRSKGVYLITGGLGGIGLAIARRLAEEWQARLVLVGRTLPRDDSPARMAIAAMEQAGAEVLVCSADVADAAQMRDALAHARDRFGPLNGVIHSAGVAGGGMIQVKSRDAAERVLAPKVAGTRTLLRLLEGETLDFVALCASLASMLGGLGQVDYCGANAFLDALAYETTPASRRTIAIDWDTWAEVGMAVTTELPRDFEAYRAQALLNAIRPDEGVEAFLRALDSGLPRVAVSTVPLASRVAQASVPIAPSMEAPASALDRRARPDLANAFVAARTGTEQRVLEIWRDLLGLEDIGVDDNFLDLGGHSLLATQLVSRVRASMHLDITVRTIFDAPTIATLAAVLDTMRSDPDELLRMIEQVEQMTDEQVRSQLEHEG